MNLLGQVDQVEVRSKRRGYGPGFIRVKGPDFFLQCTGSGLLSGAAGFCQRADTLLYVEPLYIQAGGWVVHDSDPEDEYQETVSKSRAIRKAAEDAGRFTGEGNA